LKKIITIPNILSFFRVLLVPVFVYFYFSDIENNYIYSVAVIMLSGVTDVLDGFIARRFNMISSFGKFIDPFADKLTQGVALVCISIKNPWLFPLVVIYYIKEISFTYASYLLYRGGFRPSEAKWWGKFSTLLFYFLIFMMILSEITAYPDYITIFMYSIAILCGISVIISFCGYYIIYLKIRNGKYDMEKEIELE